MRVEQVTIPMIRQVIKRPRLSGLLARLDPYGNPFSGEYDASPYEYHAAMFAEGNVVYHPMYRQWFVAGYDEARQVLSSPHVTSVEQLAVMRVVRPYSQLSERAWQFFTHFLFAMDPPEHTRLRKLVARTFTPKRMAALEPTTERVAADLLAAIADDPRPDVATRYNALLPLNLISAMLGVDEADWPWMRRTSNVIVQFLDPMRAFGPEQMNTTIDHLHEYVMALAAERRRDPKDDLVTALAEVGDDGDRLADDELLSMVGLLLFAGFETTAGLLGNAMVALADHPDQRALIRERPELWPNAVEELIRWDTSVQSDPRAAVSDLRVGDVTIPAGQNIVVKLGIANRDPREFDRPDELLLDRPNAHSVSFGHGIHHCVGAALARMEVRVGLRAFLDDFGDYEIDPSEIVWKQSLTLRGPESLPVSRASPVR